MKFLNNLSKLKILFLSIGLSFLLNITTTSIFLTNTKYTYINNSYISRSTSSREDLEVVSQASLRVNTNKQRGSATLVKVKGGKSYLLTAKHVVDGATKIDVERPETGESWTARTVNIGPGDPSTWTEDWAVLEAGGVVGTPVAFSTRQFKRFEPVLLAGYSDGGSVLFINDGNVMEDSGLFGCIWHNAMGTFGNSGGGIFVVEEGVVSVLGMCIRMRVDDGVPIYFMQAGLPFSEITGIDWNILR